MAKQLPHNKKIKTVAREVLAPMGIIQKGRSRLELDDHGWRLVPAVRAGERRAVLTQTMI
ncbi:MAG: hypothetical protein JXA33_06610 [Anaerolineae bacterium]|nr:hypothetical protein [Anaerolineae bacterium]